MYIKKNIQQDSILVDHLVKYIIMIKSDKPAREDLSTRYDIMKIDSKMESLVENCGTNKLGKPIKSAKGNKNRIREEIQLNYQNRLKGFPLASFHKLRF